MHRLALSQVYHRFRTRVRLRAAQALRAHVAATVRLRQRRRCRRVAQALSHYELSTYRAKLFRMTAPARAAALRAYYFTATLQARSHAHCAALRYTFIGYALGAAASTAAACYGYGLVMLLPLHPPCFVFFFGPSAPRRPRAAAACSIGRSGLAGAVHWRSQLHS